jgi:hypothetical protein
VFISEPPPHARPDSQASHSAHWRTIWRQARAVLPLSLRVSAAKRVLSLALLVSACSLQNFDELSDGLGSRGASGGASGNGSGGASGNGALPPNGGASGSSTDGASGSGGMSAGASGDADAGERRNLIPDPGFEAGHQGWIAFGGSAIVDVDSQGREGSRCISSIDRTETFEGPSLDIEALVEADATYWLEAWVRVSAGTQRLSLSLKTVCEGLDATYAPIVSDFAGDDEWTELSGQFTTPTCALIEFAFYVEGPASGVSFYVDDVGLYPVP